MAVPGGWDGGKVFFHVHGWRPADSPHEANLKLEDPLYQKILDAGWAIGRTAFAENGVDHPAHTQDLYRLKGWIADNLGPVERLILEGESTAGTLVLRIAEQDPDLADGVIALSPWITFDDPEAVDFLTAEPQIPAIVMANTPEINAPVQYTTLAMDAGHPPSLRPVIRPGHVNLNWVERWEAIQDLNAWIETGKAPGYTNGTRPVPPRETGTTVVDGHLVNSVVEVNVYYGNAFLGFHPDEWLEAGLKQGEPVEIEAHGERWSVLFGKTYGDVPEGDWVAFPTAGDRIMLVRNHRSAINTANLSVGDTVRVKLPE
ncbi:MAG: SAM hydroxide adenosyltransferase [Opitutales bacterium]